MRPVTILTEEPIVEIVANMTLVEKGILQMAKWVKSHRPDCVPEKDPEGVFDLLPHDRWDNVFDSEERPDFSRRPLSDNELLAEIAGRKCYDSFADKAGKKTNQGYFEHIMSMDPLHSSITYHPKLSFFFAGVSRKFSHQFIRNYVGSDRDEEGSPSQESTRFTHHYGYFIAPPYLLDSEKELKLFELDCQAVYNMYNDFIARQVERYQAKYGKLPTGAHKKDIFEAAAGYLNMSAETSFIWTTNPMALKKFLRERCHDAADAEIDRFAKVLARVCIEHSENLFQGKELDEVKVRAGIAK